MLSRVCNSGRDFEGSGLQREVSSAVMNGLSCNTAAAISRLGQESQRLRGLMTRNEQMRNATWGCVHIARRHEVNRTGLTLMDSVSAHFVKAIECLLSTP